MTKQEKALKEAFDQAYKALHLLENALWKLDQETRVHAPTVVGAPSRPRAR